MPEEKPVVFIPCAHCGKLQCDGVMVPLCAECYIAWEAEVDRVIAEEDFERKDEMAAEAKAWTDKFVKENTITVEEFEEAIANERTSSKRDSN
ncbi:MAG: hypothetical protein ACXABY_29275 [Candidatus Thorarchaeota archaeon]|jgi:hypothetical protein